MKLNRNLLVLLQLPGKTVILAKAGIPFAHFSGNVSHSFKVDTGFHQYDALLQACFQMPIIRNVYYRASPKQSAALQEPLIKSRKSG
jgi:hypothetical protein